jgi:hypothetical protein
MVKVNKKYGIVVLGRLTLQICCTTTVALLLFSTGCAMPPLQPTGQLASSLDVPQTTELLYQQAVRCWQRPQTLSADGIIAQLKPLEGGTEQLLTMHRYAARTVNVQPFFVARIYPDQPASVKIAERAYGYDLFGVEHLNFSTQLPQWLAGNTHCTPLDQSKSK